METLRDIVPTAAFKLALCGASLVAIAVGIVLFGGGEVEQSRADIFALDGAGASNTARFEDTLRSLGHTQPRSYDFNGNEVSFSTRHTRKDPRRLVEQYQRAFVRRGINQESYLGFPGSESDEGDERDEGGVSTELQKRREALMSGQIVPLEIEENYVMMGGTLVSGKPQTRTAFREELREQTPERLAEMFAGYRSIEIFRDEESGSTSVTAAWSRGDFDIKKHMPEQYPRRRGVDPDPLVPACLGCLRQMRFAGRANTRPDDLSIFRSNRPPEQVARFYDEVMKNRGWRRTPTSRTLEGLLDPAGDIEGAAIFRRYQRGDRDVTISIRSHPEHNETTVTAHRNR